MVPVLRTSTEVGSRVEAESGCNLAGHASIPVHSLGTGMIVNQVLNPKPQLSRGRNGQPRLELRHQRQAGWAITSRDAACSVPRANLAAGNGATCLLFDSAGYDEERTRRKGP
ncbi:hypothetical protein V8C37DRAFT_370805 [Trichoderma ceciliae]